MAAPKFTGADAGEHLYSVVPVVDRVLRAPQSGSGTYTNGGVILRGPLPPARDLGPLLSGVRYSQCMDGPTTIHVFPDDDDAALRELAARLDIKSAELVRFRDELRADCSIADAAKSS